MSLSHAEPEPILTGMDEGVARRVAIGAGAQGISFALSTLLQILLVPVFLTAWGKAVYGDWLVLFAAVGLLSLADLGLQGHLTVALRLAWARADAAGFRRVLRAGLGAYAVLIAVLAAALAAFAWLADVGVLLGLQNLERAEETFVLMAVPVLSLLPRGLVSAVYSARGEYGREVALAALVYTGAPLMQMLVVLGGGSPLLAAGVSCAAGLLLGWGPLLFDLRCRHPDVPLRPALPGWAELHALVTKAPYYALAAGALVLMQQLPVLVLGQMATAASVVAFTSMRTFSGLTRQAVRQLSDGTGIEMARQHARGNRAGLLRLYTGTARLTAGVVGLLAGLSLVLGPSFFALWTGGTLSFDTALAAGFFAAVLLMVPAYVAGGLLRSTDHPAAVAAASVMQVLCAIVLCPLLVAWLDALGAAVAVAVAECLTIGLSSLWVAGRLMAAGMMAAVVRAYGVMLLAFVLGVGAARALEWVIPVRGPVGLLEFGGAWSLLVALPAFYLLLDSPHRTRLLNGGLRFGKRVREACFSIY